MAVAFALGGAPAKAADPKFTDWGWPEPTEKISDKSVAWLKEKGWWPMGVAYQGPYSGQNTIMLVMDRAGMLKKRGIEAKLTSFGAGPDINEAITTGRMQVGNGGNFPFTSLLDKKIPIKVLAVQTPNLKHSIIVPKDSKYKTLADMKGANPAAVIGIVTGSSSEFYLTQAAQIVGLNIGKDVILKNMTIADQLLLPQGLAAVVPWEPGCAQLTEIRKIGRDINVIFPYNFFEGNYYVRKELVDNVPDVAQAYSDAFVESVLWIRRNMDKAIEIMLQEPTVKNFGKELLTQQTELYNNLYKPTVNFPFAEFWGKENERIAAWLYERKRIQNDLKAKDYAGAFEPKFMTKTYEKLGWAVPKTPPFLPKDWKGEPGKPPYADYYNINTLKAPQPFPEKGDLVRPWSFAGKTYQP